MYQLDPFTPRPSHVCPTCTRLIDAEEDHYPDGWHTRRAEDAQPFTAQDADNAQRALACIQQATALLEEIAGSASDDALSDEVTEAYGDLWGPELRLRHVLAVLPIVEGVPTSAIPANVDRAQQSL
jgi:hypothetical protein